MTVLMACAPTYSGMNGNKLARPMTRVWPFHYAFYPIFNLAWGGDWGGMRGVDESALPITMEVDYIRVFQKR